MSIVYFLVILFVSLIIYTLISTVIKLSLYLSIRVKYENVRLFLPVIFTLLTWVIVVSMCILGLNNYIGGNIFSAFIEKYILKESLTGLITPTLIFATFSLLIGTLIQAITYFSVNIKLENLFSYLRYFICKLFKPLKDKLKLKTKEKPENMVSKEPIEELTLGRAILASMLSTILILFSITVFVIIGLTIADKFNASIL